MAQDFVKFISGAIKNWWVPLIVGFLFIAVGIYTFMQPQESYVALSILFSVSFIVAGIAEIVFSISNRKVLDNWGWTLLFGIVSLIAGVLLVQNPSVSMVTLPFVVGFTVLFRSLMGISFALDMKNYGILDWGNLMILGVLGTIFSFILIWNPEFSGITAVVWTGILFIVAGATAIYLAFTLRKIKTTPERISKDLQDQYNKITKQISDIMKSGSSSKEAATE